MAAPTYNCPFSANAAGAGSADDSLTCAEMLALNTNASCALYDTVDEHCMLRQHLLSQKDFWRGESLT
ncbi:MAG: hypothetical protein ACE5GM_04965 [bacterium]